MLARTLVVFIAVGVVSGLLFGVYLAGLKDTNQVTYVEGHSLSVVTDKSVYAPGEKIEIRVINSGTLPLSFPDDSYGLRVTGLAGVTIFAPLAGEVEQTLNPGDEWYISWTPIQYDGTPIISGIYKIHAGHDVAASTTVTIL